MVLSYQELATYFIYDYTTGFLYRKKDKGRGKAGNQAGYKRKDGYWFLRWNGRATHAARIMFTLFHGRPPKGQIDHIDGNPSNNKIENLRDVTHSQNMSNRAFKAGKSGVVGVRRCTDCKAERYQASIKKNGKFISLGRFDSMEEAIEARKMGELEHHKGYRRA